jgi:fibro-slime domain-containing protein
LTLTALACSAGGGPGSTTTKPQSQAGSANPGMGGTGPGPLSGNGDPISLGGVIQESDSGSTGGKDPAHVAITTLPAGFTAADIGGFQLGAKLEGDALPAGGTGAGGGGGSMGDCGNILLGVARDFKGANENGNADFEADGIQGADVTPKLVLDTLGADKKPVYASKCEVGHPAGNADCPYGAQTSTQANFDEWFSSAPGKNEAYLLSFWMQPQAGGTLYTFQSDNYFPVDGSTFSGKAQADDGMQHNFAFTTEIHTQFLYRGGEVFRFSGDDDVWVFINGKLAVDVGGLHPEQERVVTLDMSAGQLGITSGNIYPLDFFHAERHTTGSHFRIDTNLSFVDCGIVIPSKVK